MPICYSVVTFFTSINPLFLSRIMDNSADQVGLSFQLVKMLNW